MATNQSHKSRAYTAEGLQRKLEKITQDVASKGIYGVHRDHDGYSVVNIPTEQPVVTGLPTRDVANTAATYFNRHKPRNLPALQREIDHINQQLEYLKADLDGYSHGLRNGDGGHFLYDRITEAEIQMNQLHRKIQRLFFV
jgi:hypothetical protein